MITLGSLAAAGLSHGFFTRQGGVSDGIFASLNCGFGSADAPDKVSENRRRAAASLGIAANRLVTCHQIHSPTVIAVERPWPHQENPRADAMVTRQRGVALGILTADCAPVLLADRDAGAIGAAHAGWRGAIGGVLEATVAAMVEAGAEPRRIRAGIGPCIGPHSYEVGAEFPAPFLAEDPANAAWFRPAPRAGHFLFDLAGYIERKLTRLGVGEVERAPGDTAGEAERFFSYRRSRLRGEADYGRSLSAIALEA